MAHGLLDELLDEQDRDPLGAQPVRHVQDPIDDDGREPTRRLVEDEELRIADDALGHRQDLLLAAAQSRGEVLAASGELGEAIRIHA